jgi:hypothetical protein
MCVYHAFWYVLYIKLVEKMNYSPLKGEEIGLSTVVHTCNPSYTGGEGGRMAVPGLHRKKRLVRPYLNKQVGQDGAFW